MDKRAVRKECFTRIDSLTREEKSGKSREIIAYLKDSPEFVRAGRIFSYWAMPSEPDLSSLFLAFPEKEWSFSRVGSDDLLAFHRVTSIDSFRKGAFGFLEPDPDHCPPVESASADLVLIPGVSFDIDSLARLGRGKGHYDRFLAKAMEGNRHLVRFGICFHVQLDQLFPESHDIPMSAIFTESGRNQVS